MFHLDTAYVANPANITGFMYRVDCTHVLRAVSPAGCLVSVNLEVFLLGAEYLKTERREDALETILMPFLGHNASDLEGLGTSFLWGNVDKVKLLRPIDLSAL